jgi:outer membrane receptor protein involved in Fe transport
MKAAVAAGLALAGACPGLARAVDEQPDTAGPRADALASGEIIVTARRKEENLEDVPQTVAVVTGDSLEKLNIHTLTELDKVVSGLQISGQQASMRGVTFIQSSVSGDTVAAYINDAPIRGNLIFTSNFDVGQIEVLRGPQGTLRGIAAPSGAITMTTRRADLEDFGGTFYGALNDHHGHNLRGSGTPGQISCGRQQSRPSGVCSERSVEWRQRSGMPDRQRTAPREPRCMIEDRRNMPLENRRTAVCARLQASRPAVARLAGPKVSGMPQDGRRAR